MGKFINIGEVIEWQKQNPGWKVKLTRERLAIAGGIELFCPNCKRALAETNGTKAIIRCRHCQRWVYLEKNP